MERTIIAIQLFILTNITMTCCKYCSSFYKNTILISFNSYKNKIRNDLNQLNVIQVVLPFMPLVYYKID